MKKVILFIFISLGIYKGYSQSKDSVTAAAKTPMIEPMGKYITLKLTQNSDLEGLSVITPTNKIILNPNISSVTRLSVNYKFISFSYGYAFKFLDGNNDLAIRGKTKGTSYNMGFNFKHWLQDLSYSRTKGYYLENTSDYDPSWKPGDPYIKFPDFVYQSFQGITSYSFNENFSVNAVSTQSERQLKSAGSFIPHLLYRYYIMDDRTPQTGSNITQKSKNFELVTGAGYYYSFVLKHNFYLSLGATPGFGVVFSNLTTRFPAGYTHTHQTNAIFRFDARAGIGYNGERFFTGLYSKLSTIAFNQQNTSAVTNDSRMAIQLFFGYRIKAPRIVQESVQKASSLIKL